MAFYPVGPVLTTAGGTIGPLTVNGNLSIAGNVTTTALNTVTAQALDINLAGGGLRVAEGSGTNAKQGVFTLSGAATTTVTNTVVQANSRVLLTCQALGTVSTPSALAVSSRVAATSFTVTPSQATDTSTIAFEIFDPG